jgi:hypothetical protein
MLEDSSKLYFNDVWNQKLWQESVFKINVKQTKGNERFYLYLYPIGDLAQRNFYVCINPN